MIRGFKKYAAIFGLFMSCTLVTSCIFKENEDIVLTENELKSINKKLESVRIHYEYEDYYLGRKELNKFNYFKRG